MYLVTLDPQDGKLFLFRAYRESVCVLMAARLLLLSLCTIRLLYSSGSDGIDRKAKFLYELLQWR
jgi:hypothetical protein